MKLIINFLILAAFLFPVQAVNGKAGQPVRSGPAASRKPFPGSVVRFEHLTVQDGLSQNTGSVLFQDSHGFLWIGTQDGLNRYDGYGFRIYRHDPQNTASISSDSILSITEDQGGFLWIGTQDGLNRFDPVTEEFTSYQHLPDRPSSLSDNTVTSLLEDSRGVLWVGTLHGLERFNPQINGFDHFGRRTDDPSTTDSWAVSVIFEDSNHQLWIGTGALGIPGSGLIQFDPSTGTVVTYQHNDRDPTSLSSNTISSIYEAPDGNFWIGTGGYDLPGQGLNLFNPYTGTAIHYLYDPGIEDSISGNEITSLWGDASGGLWIGTRSSGLNHMDFSYPGRFTRYLHNPYFPDSLSANEVRSLFKDRSGILWTGTANHGLNKLALSSGKFSLYRNNPSDPESLGTNNIGAFAEDANGYIWVGTWGGGLDRFDPRNGTFRHFRNLPGDPRSLSNNLVTSVYADPQHVIWVGTLGGGLNRLEPATGRFERFLHRPYDSTSLVDNNVSVIIPDGLNGLWLGTYGGLSHYNPATQEFTNYVNNYAENPANPATLSENKVISLYLDQSEKILWVGTWGGGLNRLDLKNPLSKNPQLAPFETYRYNSGDPTSLSENTVWTIHKSANGNLWLGTQSGLNRFEPRTQIFKRYTEKEGLTGTSVLGILGDEWGCLWMTTNRGLVKFDVRSGMFSTYDVTDGLQANEFNTNAFFRSRNGIMFIGGPNGFNMFAPQDIGSHTVPPPVAITKLEVFNEPLMLDLSGQEPVRLSYRQDLIAFEFAALDFHASRKNRYAYMLEGYDSHWIETGNRYAGYANLPAGEYTFHVKASNSDGVWNVTGISIELIITPPVWETWWFRSLGLLVLALVTACGFQWRLSTIRAQKADLERQVAVRTAELKQQIDQREKAELALAEKAAQEAVTIERTRLARDLHDAVSQTLFSASLIAEVLPDIWTMNQAEGWKRLAELRLLTRGALAEMRTLLLELRPSALTEMPFPELLCQLCESLMGRTRLPIQLSVEGTCKLPPDVQIGLYRITQEALNNIVKHARATKVQVILNIQEKVCLSIFDNGCGFNPATDSPDHLGLKIMRERAESISAHLSIYSVPGEGTQILVSWPLHKEKWRENRERKVS